ncbi:MAG: efflux RND transporter permease subunit [Alphaproteobacteria bacterium]
MNGLVAWWARNAVAANLLMVGIVLAGTLGFFRMEREVFPTFRLNWVEVTVAWQGASPQDVEEQLIVRIEEALADLDNVERIRATASEGFGQVYVEAYPRVDIGDFINEVKLRIDGISSFPTDIEQPQVREIVARNEIMYIAVFGDADERVLKRTAERLRDEVSLLPGASLTELVGTRREEVSIEVSEEALRRYRLAFDDVVRAVRSDSINLSSGTVRTDTGGVQLRVRNLADTQADFEDIIIRETRDGAIIRVRDVATVIDGFEDFLSTTRFDGQPGFLIGIRAGERMNVVTTANAVKAWVEETRGAMPAGLSVELFLDDSKTYFDRMETISNSAMIGLALVFLVLILFLRTRVAVWVSIGIATAFAGAFVFLPALDVSLNMLTLFAFLLVIGIVVDDAIIVGENIHARVEKGEEGVTGAVVGTQMVLKPVIFAVVTTMIAFAPWLFLSGAQVQVTRQMSLIIILALTFSLVEALLILPAHLAKMTRKTRYGRIARVQQGLADSLIWFAETVYRPIIRFCVLQRYLTVTIFVFFLTVSVGVVSSGFVKFSFSPEIENELVQFDITFPDGTPFERSEVVGVRVEQAQRQLIKEFEADLGGVRLIEHYFIWLREGAVTHWMLLTPSENRDISARTISTRLRELVGEIPDAEEINLDFTINDSDTGIDFAVNAPRLDLLRAAVDELKEKLRTYSAAYDVRDNLQSSTPEIRLKLKPGAEQIGLTLGEVSRQVRQAYFGEEVQRLPRDGNDVRVFVRYPREARRSLESLENFRIRTSDGREIPLFSVAEVEFGPGINRINRRERQRSVQVSAELTDDIGSRIRQELNEDFFPSWKTRYPGVTIGAIGSAEGQAQFFAEIQSLYTIAFLAMYAMLAIAFRSYWQPLLVMTAIPFGYMGAVYGHMIFGLTMALFSYFGIAAAAGVVVNDNLVLLDQVNRMRGHGASALEALVESGVSRFRPILLTSVTTFIGLLPMIAERSIQAQFLKPTVVALAFGVAFATFVTLLFVPALYAVGADIARFFRWAYHGTPRADLDTPTDVDDQAPATL